mmetsp:Transcript_27265/g.45440  ORF Transcript_27265/g.45440 Transcript_27265/m.45440 type:complete len:346 (+) Transcript_27265:17-1054(+)
MNETLMDLVAMNEEQWLQEIPKLIEAHGQTALSSWRNACNKHKHRLVHTAASKDFVFALKLLAECGFDVNVQRESDQCTPLHLAIFYKKKRAADVLKTLGADSTLKNSYGESCDSKYEKLAESMQNLLFLDLELTSGFYDSEEERPRILEVALIVTDKDLNELGRGQWVLGGFTADELNSLKEFHQKTYRDATPGGAFPPLPDSPGNGLFTDVMSSGTPKDVVVQQMLALLRKFCVDKACPLVGNSIQCDREVLKEEMPEVYGFLNHRIVDVSSFIGMMERWLPDLTEAWKADQAATSNYNHRAINDVESSIQSMRWVREHLLVQPAASSSTAVGPTAKKYKAAA